jgi:hypothetical protein
MDPRQVGRYMGRFCQWGVNILSIAMVVGGLHLIFFSADRDDQLTGSANVLLGATLFSLGESQETEDH